MNLMKMGAYLSEPKIEKTSSDESSDTLIVGASSMQGWRNSQEDAHNAILNFDENTALFAVYDGHGGAEVAQYCADKLPEFLKELLSYKKNKYEEALKDTFMEFDKTLLEPEVVNILKILAGDRCYLDPDDSYDEDDEDLDELHEEGNLPLEQLLIKYEGHPDIPELLRMRDNALQNSKPQSPYLRGRRAAAIAAEAANKEAVDPDAKPPGSSTSAAAAASAGSAVGSNVDGDGPSSSNEPPIQKLENQEPEDDSTVSSSSSSGSKTNNNQTVPISGTEAEAATPQKLNGSDSVLLEVKSDNLTADKAGDQNGSVTSSEPNVVKTDVDVSTSSPSETTEQKIATSDATVSGSSDASAYATKENGNVATSSSANSSKDRSVISSTSKDAEKANKSVIENDEDEDDADYVADNSCLDDTQEMDVDINVKEDIGEYDDNTDDDEGDDEDDDDDDDDDDEDDDDDDEYDEEIDEEGNIIRKSKLELSASVIEEPGKDSGCTAVVTLLRGRDLYVANAGDSRCVVCRNGKALEMSLDHKPEDEVESMRILKAGGRVTLDGRVNGGLNLSRAIGDHAYKMNMELPAEEQMISAVPDIKKLIISPEDEFMILACDGIWNYMSSEEVIEFVRSRIEDESMKLSKICEELFDHCLAPNTMGDGTGCDNMTAVIVKFKPKIYELETKINAEETEDVRLAKQPQKAVKRAAPPVSPDQLLNEAEEPNKSKRLKTDNDDGVIDSVAKNIIDTSATTTTTTTIETTASSSTPACAEQKECDSINHTNNDIAEGVVASST